MSCKKLATWLGVKRWTTPRQVFKPDIKNNLQTLPLELQEKIYKDIWQGLARVKSQLVTVELLCREIHKRKVKRINQQVRFLWIKGVFILFFRFSPFTTEDFMDILNRYPEWLWSEITHFVRHFRSRRSV
jgi:hypothetical protein